jgi:integrase
MSATTLRTPSYRHHKPSGQAVVTLDGRDIYLGRYGTPQSRAEFDRLLAEWLSNGRRLPAPASAHGTDLSVNELSLAYLAFADGYYTKRGKPTSEPGSIRQTIKPLRQLYGHTLAREFGPLQLKAVRQAMIDAGLCRNEVNKRTGRIVRLFKWAVGEGIVPPSLHHGLIAVSGLRRGRADVRESEPVKPVPDAFVDAIRPHVPPQLWAMVELMRLSGMRPQEVCLMRTIDIDRSGRVWIFTPETHKTEHHGRERRIYLGPTAQEILRPWLRMELTAYLFSPREAMQHRLAERRRNRKSKVQPSQKNRSKAGPKRKPGERYDTRSLYHAVAYGIRKAQDAAKKAGERPIADWHPNQLRHNAATRLRREFGLDVARAVLGHSSPVVTEVYAELDGAKAAEAMERVG